MKLHTWHSVLNYFANPMRKTKATKTLLKLTWLQVWSFDTRVRSLSCTFCCRLSPGLAPRCLRRTFWFKFCPRLFSQFNIFFARLFQSVFATLYSKCNLHSRHFNNGFLPKMKRIAPFRSSLANWVPLWRKKGLFWHQSNSIPETDASFSFVSRFVFGNSPSLEFVW